MAGGIGILGVPEEGVTKRVIRHIFAIIEAQKQSFLPGDKVEVRETAVGAAVPWTACSPDSAQFYLASNY